MQKNRLGNFPTRFIIEPIKPDDSDLSSGFILYGHSILFLNIEAKRTPTIDVLFLIKT